MPHEGALAMADLAVLRIQRLKFHVAAWLFAIGVLRRSGARGLVRRGRSMLASQTGTER